MNLWLTRAAGRKLRRSPFGADPNRLSARKRLIVNADDLGFTQDVNEGILRAHLEGIVTSASLMANGAAFGDAVERAQRCPSLDIGCHLVLVQGESLARQGEALPTSLGGFLVALPAKHDILREFRAQLDRLLAHGIRPTHLDTHKHVHLLPRVLDAVLEVAKEYGIRWIRKPFDIPLGWARRRRAWLSLAIGAFRIPFEERLQRASCRTADYFAGFAATGALDSAWLADLFAQLPGGVGEFVCHPGVCGAELAGAATKLKESREAELEALCSPSVRKAAAEQGIQLISYRDLPTAPDAPG